VDDGLHLVPLVEFKCVLGKVSAERGSGVTVSSITLGELSLVVDAIRLHEALNVSPRFVESITHLINK
jgi:hypothetical protein